MNPDLGWISRLTSADRCAGDPLSSPR